MPQLGPQVKPAHNTKPNPKPEPELDSDSAQDSDSDSDASTLAIPLEKQAVFGAGLKRKRITFVPAGSLQSRAETQAGTLPISRAASAQTYWDIVSGKQTQTQTQSQPMQGTKESKGKAGAGSTSGSTSGSISRIKSGVASRAGLDSSLSHAGLEGERQQPSGQESEGSATEWTTDDEYEHEDGHEKQDGICPVCNLPLHLTTYASSATHPTHHEHKHESLLAHQVSLPHIHPPSALDRRRMGVQYLKAWGWDVDSRTGLGKLGTGRRDIVRVVNKQDTLGLGVEIGKGGKPIVKKPTLNAKQARAAAVKDRKRADELRARLFGREEEVQRLLNGV